MAKKKTAAEKRAETIEKRQQKLKDKIVEKLERNPVIYAALSQCGTDKSTYYRWMESDGEFRLKANTAIEEGRAFVNDMIESVLVKKAKEGQVSAITFWLRNNHAQYNENIKNVYNLHLQQDMKLSDERVAEISTAVKAWNNPDPNEDERDEDYESDYGDDKKEKKPDRKQKVVKKKLPKAKLKRVGGT